MVLFGVVWCVQLELYHSIVASSIPEYSSLHYFSRTHHRTCQDSFIPTCAGLTPENRFSSMHSWKHPHVCGAYLLLPRKSHAISGPSPRVRGLRMTAAGPSGKRGSIPTCAGLTFSQVKRARGLWVHPHVCGAYGAFHQEIVRFEGPSPRVRGLLRKSTFDVVAHGSIPTCAGLTLNDLCVYSEQALFWLGFTVEFSWLLPRRF